MASIEIYEPPMCCSSGVCGPVVDPALPRIAADVRWLKERGVTVHRYNLGTIPGAFARCDAVRALLEEKGQTVLPVVVVDGRVVAQGAYPDRATLASLVALPAPRATAAE